MVTPRLDTNMALATCHKDYTKLNKIRNIMCVFFVEVDNCATKPCKNQGVCINAVNAFSCNCTEGYSGATCRTGKLSYLSGFLLVIMVI